MIKDYSNEQRKLAQAKTDVAEGGLIGIIIGLLIITAYTVISCILLL